MSCAGCRFGYLGTEAGDAVREAWRKLDQPGASLDDIETCPQRQPGPSVYAPSER